MAQPRRFGRIPRFPNVGIPALARWGEAVRQFVEEIATIYSGTGGIILSGLTASRLMATDASKELASVTDLTSWVAGTANRVTVADDADGTITLSGPQDIHTGASPTFAGATLSGLTASRLAATDGAKALASVANLASWIAGTANQVTVADDGDGTVTLSGPQDLAAGSSPTFTGANLSGLTASRMVSTDGSKNLQSSTPGAVLTTQVTTLTHSEPGTPDYAIQDATAGGFGYVTLDEFLSHVKATANLQARVAELESRLQAHALIS